MTGSISVTVTLSTEAELRKSQQYVDRRLDFPDGSNRHVQLKAIEWEVYDELLAAGMTAMEINTVPFEEACKIHSGFYGPRTNTFTEELLLCFVTAIRAWWPSLPSRDRRPANFPADADYHREQGCTRLIVVSDQTKA